MSQLLWVHKSAESETFSQSSRPEEARIRHHVQHTRRSPVASRTANSAVKPSLSHAKQSGLSSLNAALKSSLRPSSFLGRIEKSSSRNPAAPKNRTRMGLTASGYSPDRIYMPWQFNKFQSVPQTLPWSWQDLCWTERRSLAFFELRTSRDWAGWDDACFWNVLALQVAQRSTAIAHSLIALSALHESLEATEDLHKTNRQRSSLVHIHKALQALAGHDLSHFEALVSCLVILCFQNLQHNRNSFLLLRAGSRLLKEYDSNPTRRQKVSSEEADMIEKYVRPLFNRLNCRPCRVGDLSVAFELSVRRNRVKDHRHETATKPLVPSSFITLAGARNCLHGILRWAHENLLRYSVSQSEMQDFLHDLDQLREAWGAALDNNWTQSCANEHPASTRSRTLLHVSCMAGMIIIKSFGATLESVYDRYLAEFTKIVELVEQANSGCSTHVHETSFGIDDGLVDILAFVGSKCRHPSVRRRAMNTLVHGNRVEGDRIASIPGEILRVLIDLEERGLDVSSCGNIPETRRRRLLYGHQIYAKQHIRLIFVGAPYDPALGASVEERFIPLPGPIDVVSEDTQHSDGPDVVFGSGFAAFLENPGTQRYFRVDLDQFFFPIPKS